MVTTPNFDLDVDTTLGGSNASDYIIPSQKAIKSYVDNNSGGGGTVDQTYDSTSANAQSGVAIAGAKFLQNEATQSGSSIILQGLTKNRPYAIGIGVNNSATDYCTVVGATATTTGNYSTAIGYYARTSSTYATALGNGTYANAQSSLAVGNGATTSQTNAMAVGTGSLASGTRATALGSGATASGNYAIQIGYGTNNTANTLNVGFWNSTNTHYNWQLLDGATGLIPDARISTNIARTSSVADNVLSNVSSIDSNSAVATALDGKANTDLSNLSATGETKIDNSVLAILDTLYPIGSVYIGTMATCPLQTLGIGTWTLVSSGRVLQGSDSNNIAGSTVNASLPSLTTDSQGDHSHNRGTMNISGGPITVGRFASTNNATVGALSTKHGTSRGTGYYGSTTSYDANLTLTASSNWSGTTNTTGSHTHTAEWTDHVGTTVQPDAYIVNIWERTA